MERNIPKFDVLPQHIGFIMDGNGRWAKMRGLERSAGHKEGALTFRRIGEYCADVGIKYMTFYAFSTENWNRPKSEVLALMKLFKEYIKEGDERIAENAFEYAQNYTIYTLPENDGFRKGKREMEYFTEDQGVCPSGIDFCTRVR